jgi:hypothetical protein
VGLFKRGAGAVAKGADALYQMEPATELIIALSPSIRRVGKLEERGTPTNGVITGIRFSLNGDTTRKEFAITIPDSVDGTGGPDASQGGARRIGVGTRPALAHRLRLGVPVVVKLDGDRGILDWDAMADAWGLGDRSLFQESLRKPPPDGVEDTALDMRVERRLKKWAPTRATLASHARVSALGMPTLNWDLELRLPDGSTALVRKDEVPSYAQWFVAPGVDLPAVVDPKDPSRAAVDWPRFALDQFEHQGFDDDPPAGSIAAELEAARGTPPPQVMGGPASPPAATSGGPVELDATMRSWVDMAKAGHMSAKDVDRAIADWQEAGMCNAAQAAAARAEAGLA